MKQAMVRVTLAVLLVSGVAGRVAAQDATAKMLPTLLIKGEVVSVDPANPGGTLLKVKDRYGFETPIYLAQETKITQGGQDVSAEGLAGGTAVEVEYNFDINTAKRHAVSVMVAAAPAPVAAASAVATPAAETPAPVAAPAMTEPAPVAAEPAAPASEQPAQ
jgi:hypothetical protein